MRRHKDDYTADEIALLERDARQDDEWDAIERAEQILQEEAAQLLFTTPAYDRVYDPYDAEGPLWRLMGGTDR